MSTRSKLFIAVEIFFLLTGILFIITAAAGVLFADRQLLFIILGIIITIGAFLRIYATARAPKVGNKNNS
ncbi:hypothetical protein [Alkalicoccus saliphilus]|jgi:hypothetical protein|uniref:Uncharacterized protein n=1 Tax=Alkalicoccus saliphilus TaxID=200989 RepID=A0A2T4U9Y7_9BACI|nr:hypothetical protein [Alkalicoccus saliphilus]PTL40207.1 hypothetical protein C6Y45_02165 [Alkalicoccus saliphilus]